MASKFSTTTKDVGLLLQLKEDGQLHLAPEFQRNSIWPRAAKSYLIDTILSEKPIPVLYFQRTVSAQTNRVEYNVVDGQQRLSALFQFIENRFSLTESNEDSPWYRRRWKTLSPAERERILSYDFVVQELSGYSPEAIRDMFTRMNRFVRALSPQELRHANAEGAFKSLVENVGQWPFWAANGVFSAAAANRMKRDEFAAELIILLIEGPQDKKKSVDFYYEAFQSNFDEGSAVVEHLDKILTLSSDVVPDLKTSMFRRPANLYALVGALGEILHERELDRGDIFDFGGRMREFIEELNEKDDALRTPRASKYFVAQSRQTDNVQPRRWRMDILKDVLLNEG